MSAGIVVVGQLGRDLVVSVDELPAVNGSTSVSERREMLGGKGANQAVGLCQLGAEVVLVGVVGEDVAGQFVLDQAAADGIDVTYVARRGRTALLLDVVTPDGVRRLFEDVPDTSLATEMDVRNAAEVIRAADTLCLQLQQPAGTVLAAARLARASGIRVVLDGGLDGPERDAVLACADVVRCDAAEVVQLTGLTVHDQRDAERAAAALLGAGAQVAACAVPGAGDLVVWPQGSMFYPFGDGPVVDATGAGDAFLAGLVTGLRRGDGPAAAGQLAASAAAATVARLGGRPDLTGLR